MNPTGLHSVVFLFLSGVLSAASERGPLHQVYAARGVPGLGLNYSHTRWFDEHPIGFGINEARQKAYLSTQSKTVTIENHREDGFTLGAHVPLESIDTVFALSRDLEQVEAWKNSVRPDWNTVSYEATYLMKVYGPKLENYARERRISLSQAWRDFVSQTVHLGRQYDPKDDVSSILDRSIAKAVYQEHG